MATEEAQPKTQNGGQQKGIEMMYNSTIDIKPYDAQEIDRNQMSYLSH